MKTDDKPWWKTEGLVVAGGWHPITGRIRARIPEETVEEDYAWEYTEEHILRLKELGVTLLISQFDRGLGDSDQAEDQERARLQAELCHKHGLRHGVYLPNTIYYESELKDHPECEEWAVETRHGGKTFYGGEQTWRWVACSNAPGWRARMKRQIERAITVVKTDLLHFDNLGLSLEPDSCNCDTCQEKFREFLARRYPTAEAQKRRFGFTGFDTFRIPVFWDYFSMPWDLNRIQSPLLQEWVSFRIATVTDYIADLTTYARELNPGICIDSNGQAPHGNNMGLIQGRGDSEGQVKYVDVMIEENPDLRPDDDPRAIFPVTRHIRGMLLGRRLDKEMLTAYRDEEELAFNLTFAGNPGINTHWGYAEPGRMPLKPHQPGVKELLDHRQRHLGLYTQYTPASRVAVWRNQQSLAYICFDSHLSACVMEHVLFTNRIPFSIVQDGFINDEGLSQFDLLILPNVEFVSDEQAKVLSRFVERGGALLMTERSGMCTEEPRIRRTGAFVHLFRGALRGASSRLEENVTLDESRQASMREEGGRPDYAVFGSGKVAYIPKIRYIHGPRTFKSRYNMHYDGIDSRYWKEPHNAAEILSAVEWLCPAVRPVATHGAPELRLDYLRLADGGLAVTMMRCGELDGPRNVPFSVLAERRPEEGALYVPEEEQPLPLEWVASGARFETMLRGVRRHAVVRYLS